MKYCLILFFNLIVQLSVCQNFDVKSINARRIDSAPVMDGVLDDEVWGNAQIATGFMQARPFPGAKASQKTEVKVLYDNTAIYIGAKLYDVAKDSIMRQLSQRDNEGNTDYFAVFIDTYNDDQSGYGFSVQPTGVQVDARYSQNQGEDISWNAVWMSEVTIDNDGWYVEMKIPYSAIRFPEKGVQEWGINFQRSIRRHREMVNWNHIDPKVNGFVNQWGDLAGVKGIESPVRLAFLPYVSSYLEHFPFNVEGKSNYSNSINGGMDVKYGINDAFTLDMTLIPDFGQVQSDNQVLNLSPFEVRFDENRPFFTEGTELFNKGGLFYSRRLGSRPINYSSASDNLGVNESVINNPAESQLINATKISGRTKSGLGVGVFNGVTKNMFAEVKDSVSGQTREVLTDPLTNYNVLVLDQNLKNNSYATFINTNVTRSGSVYDANVSRGMFKINDKKNVFSVEGGGTLSQLYFSDSLSLGHAIDLAVEKNGGNLNYGIEYFEESDTYDPNDLGFLYNNNSRGGSVFMEYRIFDPFWKFLNTWSELKVDYERLYNPDKFTTLGISAETGVNWRNFLTTGVNYRIDPIEIYDYFEPRVWGRFYTIQSSHNAGGFISSDYRKTFALDINTNFRKFDAHGRYRFNYRISPRIRFSDKFSMVYSFERNGFVEDEGAAIDLDGEGTIINGDIIFGKRDQTTYTNVLSASYIFTNRMGLTFRARHYWSKVDYNSFHILDNEGYLTASNYTGVALGGESLHNTNFNAFSVDMVYRWVFAPGSELSLVFKSNLTAFDNNIARSYSDNFKNTLESKKTKSISLKLL
ncbi:MAG: DUF5916 domain-containing protein, partial [Vicingaceae bacterium]|nr:DUF5916 domain-containing protein [Vicingaceae bacterium]